MRVTPCVLPVHLHRSHTPTSNSTSVPRERGSQDLIAADKSGWFYVRA